MNDDIYDKMVEARALRSELASEKKRLAEDLRKVEKAIDLNGRKILGLARVISNKQELPKSAVYESTSEATGRPARNARATIDRHYNLPD
jgi:hypothetical protein